MQAVRGTRSCRDACGPARPHLDLDRCSLWRPGARCQEEADAFFHFLSFHSSTLQGRDSGSLPQLPIKETEPQRNEVAGPRSLSPQKVLEGCAGRSPGGPQESTESPGPALRPQPRGSSSPGPGGRAGYQPKCLLLQTLRLMHTTVRKASDSASHAYNGAEGFRLCVSCIQRCGRLQTLRLMHTMMQRQLSTSRALCSLC